MEKYELTLWKLSFIWLKILYDIACNFELNLYNKIQNYTIQILMSICAIHTNVGWFLELRIDIHWLSTEVYIHLLIDSQKLQRIDFGVSS
jgi:hypothetical protein